MKQEASMPTLQKIQTRNHTKALEEKIIFVIDGYLLIYSSKEVSRQMAIWVACGIH